MPVVQKSPGFSFAGERLADNREPTFLQEIAYISTNLILPAVGLENSHIFHSGGA